MSSTPRNLSGAQMRDFFDRLAPRYDWHQSIHPYYHRLIANIYRSCIPPHSTIIDFGCGTGSLLAQLSPSGGCGVDFSPQMVARAAQRFGGHVRIVCESFEAFVPSAQYAYAVIANTLEYVDDIDALLAKAHQALREDGKIIVTSVNPVWKPMVRLAGALRLKTPDIEKNFLTNKDIVNFLECAGFEVIEEGVTGACLLYVPFITPLLNFLIKETPLIRQLGIIQYVVAKKRRAPRDYRCSVIVPCHNESGNIKSIIQETPRMGLSTELIFVDDGSNDGTAAQVDPSLRSDIAVACVSYAPNRGKKHAVRAGFEAAKGDILFILDADASVPPQELKKCYRVLAQGSADFVNGSRCVYPMEGRAMKLANYIGNKLFCLLVSWIMKQRVTDTLCGTKAFFSRDLAAFPKGCDPWGDYDFLFGAACLRLRIRDVAIHYRQRRFGRSKMRALRHALFLLGSCWWGIKMIKFPSVAMRKASVAV